MNWLIEDDVFDGYNDLKATLEKMEINFKSCGYVPFDTEAEYLQFNDGEDVFFHGSLNCLKRLQYLQHMGQLNWKLIDYCNWPSFRASVAYNRFRWDAINHEYGIATVDETLNNLERIFSDFFKVIDGAHKIFCRSDEGDKKLSGGVFDIDQLRERIEMNLNVEYLSRNDLLVFSEVHYINREYRLIIKDGKIVTGSNYIEKGNLINDPNDFIPDELDEFVDGLMTKYQFHPAKVFVLDVAETWNEYVVLETGSVNCCGLYGCDLKKFVAAI